jgi:thioredoxin 1
MQKNSLPLVRTVALVFLICASLVWVTCTQKKESNEAHKSRSDAARQQSSAGAKTSSHDGMPSVTSSAHLEALIRDSSDDKVLMVDMYADWCKPCKLLAPKLATIAQEKKERVRLYQLDVQKHKDVARAYRVRAIPNVVFFYEQEKVEQIPGLRPKSVYERIIDRY